ncbi:MAG: hypothetical protein MUC94_16540 [bacterium]|nr:hypothetical protein [bacterium]
MLALAKVRIFFVNVQEKIISEIKTHSQVVPFFQAIWANERDVFTCQLAIGVSLNNIFLQGDAENAEFHGANTNKYLNAEIHLNYDDDF